MADADSKQWRIRSSNNLPALDAELADLGIIKNQVCAYKIETFAAPDQMAPYTVRKFFSDIVPDNTSYPDTIAPIGSEVLRLILTSGVVTGSLKYLKTSAGTWQSYAMT